MVRSFLAALCLAGLLASPAARAACTWSTLTSTTYKVVCTTGNESAPTLESEGAPLGYFRGFNVTAEADSGQTFTAAPGGTLQAYLWVDAAQAWVRVPDLDLSIGAASVRRQAFMGFQVVSPRGRIAYVPVSVTLSAGGITLYVAG